MCSRWIFLLFSCFLFSAAISQKGEKVSDDFRLVTDHTLVDIRLHKKVRLKLEEKPLSVFIFLSPECPLSQKYTKALNELQYNFKQVQFIGIIPGEAYSEQEVVEFINKYQIVYSIYIDPGQKLTRYLQATVTPQVILLNKHRHLVYTGAIDNWAFSLGKTRLKATKNYIQDAIEQTLNGTLVKITKTNPIGCKINDY